ncbi:hypothetical protein SAMN02910357_00170 [Succinivibrio dextrinosolvens]|nr:hypothetical protein SAMN02910357_00170 [Succinivibrio dextrinosolvens]
MQIIDIAVWTAPRLFIWIIISAYFIKKFFDLAAEDDVKNRNKIALLLFLVFFVFLPICFAY